MCHLFRISLMLWVAGLSSAFAEPSEMHKEIYIFLDNSGTIVSRKMERDRISVKLAEKLRKTLESPEVKADDVLYIYNFGNEISKSGGVKKADEKIWRGKIEHFSSSRDGDDFTRIDYVIDEIFKICRNSLPSNVNGRFFVIVSDFVQDDKNYKGRELGNNAELMIKQVDDAFGLIDERVLGSFRKSNSNFMLLYEVKRDMSAESDAYQMACEYISSSVIKMFEDYLNGKRTDDELELIWRRSIMQLPVLNMPKSLTSHQVSKGFEASLSNSNAWDVMIKGWEASFGEERWSLNCVPTMIPQGGSGNVSFSGLGREPKKGETVLYLLPQLDFQPFYNLKHQQLPIFDPHSLTLVDPDGRLYWSRKGLLQFSGTAVLDDRTAQRAHLLRLRINRNMVQLADVTIQSLQGMTKVPFQVSVPQSTLSSDTNFLPLSGYHMSMTFEDLPNTEPVMTPVLISERRQPWAVRFCVIACVLYALYVVFRTVIPDNVYTRFRSIALFVCVGFTTCLWLFDAGPMQRLTLFLWLHPFWILPSFENGAWHFSRFEIFRRSHLFENGVSRAPEDIRAEHVCHCLKRAAIAAIIGFLFANIIVEVIA